MIGALLDRLPRNNLAGIVATISAPSCLDHYRSTAHRSANPFGSDGAFSLHASWVAQRRRPAGARWLLAQAKMVGNRYASFVHLKGRKHVSRPSCKSRLPKFHESPKRPSGNSYWTYGHSRALQS